MTRDEMVSDLELRLSRWKPSDDFELPRNLISHWVDLARNELVQSQIEDDIEKGKDIDKRYLKTINGLRPAEETGTVNLDQGLRYFIDLGEEVMNLPDDVGVWRVSTNTGRLLAKQEFQDYDIICKLHFSKPSLELPSYYREGTKLFIEGLNAGLVNRAYYNVSIIPSSFSDSEFSDELILAPDMERLVAELAEEIGLRNLRISADIDNDGEDDVRYE